MSGCLLTILEMALLAQWAPDNNTPLGRREDRGGASLDHLGALSDSDVYPPTSVILPILPLHHGFKEPWMRVLDYAHVRKENGGAPSAWKTESESGSHWTWTFCPLAVH